MERVFAGVAVMAACAALAACSSFDNSVSVKAAQPDGRKLNVSWQPRQTVHPARWPNACELLSEKEIKAFLPEASDFRRTSEWATSSGDRAENGKCVYTVKLPSPSGRPFPNEIPISIDNIGDPALIAKSYAGARKSDPGSDVVRDMDAAGADACFGIRAARNDVPKVTCHKGPLMFTIELSSWYANFDGVGREDVPGKNRVIEERVLPAVIQTVVAKL